MTNIIVSGICGKMGRFIVDTAKNYDINIIAGFDIAGTEIDGIPVYSNLDEISGEVDAIIDFSRPATLDALVSFAEKKSAAVVFATTGYTDDQKEKIKKLSEKVPVFYSANMSLGISLIKSLAKKAAEILGEDFDIEIIEKHHNMKVDAPSGTALALAESINEVFDGNKQLLNGRTPEAGKRKAEIGIHAVRGGTVVGEHEVGFYGNDEIITITHSARSRKIFASGAIKAAMFISGKTPGMYSMEDII